MSWDGDFQIKYKGGHTKEFHKLAKMIIPNSIVRFDFDSSEINSNSVELACTRNLSWYSADEDMKKLLSYMPDGDSISMEIYGEGVGIPEMLYEDLSDEYAID